jgi:hypothetical protein
MTEVDETRPISPATEAAAQAAFEVEQQIIATKKTMERLWVQLAGYLYRFNDLAMWKDLGYRSFEEWLASPHIDIGRRHVFGLIQVWRELVIKHNVKPTELEGVRVSSALNILPAIRRGQVPVEEALSDAKTLSREDLRERYERASATVGPDTSTTYDADAEPQHAICPACGSRYRVKS